MEIGWRSAGALFLTCVLATTRDASAAENEVSRASLVAAALRVHPAIKASEARAVARRRVADAEGSLPPPEVMTQIWQVPLAKPYAIGDAQMIMIGVGQTFPAIGARAARQRAGELDATAEQAMTADRARQIRREVDHAFADYVEATSRHRIHLVHQTVAKRTAAVASARHAAGGSLLDRAQADVEIARIEADVVTDGTRVDAARGRLNVLTGRDATAPLGPPENANSDLSHDASVETTAWDAGAALSKARENRPELRAADALAGARREEAKAAKNEALIPSFSVAALYFAPTSPLPQHGYGMNASVTLPWLWGEASSKRDASQQSVVAAAKDASAARIPVEAEVVAQEANVRAATLRFVTLRDLALPASQRAFDVAWSGYESNRTDLMNVLTARRAVVDVESEMIAARATLDHALADLDAAVGIEVPRRKLLSVEKEGGAQHGPR